MKSESEIIKATIIKNYIHGAFNETNIEAFNQVFHPGFAIVNLKDDGNLFLFTRIMWQEVLEKRINNPDFDYKSIAVTAHFRNIDIEIDKASVTLDLNLEDKRVYTDFLLLVKFKGRWNIVSKIYTEH